MGNALGVLLCTGQTGVGVVVVVVGLGGFLADAVEIVGGDVVYIDEWDTRGFAHQLQQPEA